MVRGTHKQMVVLRTNDSHFYEQAYFVLRDGHAPHGESESTMLAEANRILDESMLMPQPRKRMRLSRWWVLLIGGALGALLTVGAMLLFGI